MALTHEKKKEMMSKLEDLVHFRYNDEELVTELKDILEVDNINLDEHFVDGKMESPNEIYDDSFTFDLEKEWGDLYVFIYFIKTNEDDYYITEVAYDFDEF